MDNPPLKTPRVLKFPAKKTGNTERTALPETIQLGSVELNRKQLMRKLRYDMKDDWFPDPRQFKDMVEGGIAVEQIVANFEANHGEYVPMPRDEFNLPKPNFTLRYALETSLSDRILYHGLTDFLIPFFDPLIPWTVFNHRYNPAKPSGKTTFGRGVDAWKHFHGNVRTALKLAYNRTSRASLLSTDVSSYYEYIDLQRLKSTILSLLPEVKASPSEKSRIRAHTELLFSFLQHWSYDSYRGLPQNRDASSFLGNLYMYPVDRAMIDNGYKNVYFRYMDDIKIVCDDEFRARRALKDLSLALRKIGLSLNSKKTEICGAVDKDCLSRCLDEASIDAQVIDEMWRSRSRPVILRSFAMLSRLTLDTAAKNRYDSKDFRFCVNKLRVLATCPDFEAPEAYFHGLTPALIEGLTACPASTDKLAEYLIAAPTREADLDAVAAHLCDDAKCLYNWQNYLLWSLLARKKHLREGLTARAIEIIETGDDNPTRAGATVYLGVTGNSDAKERISRRFSSLTSFIGQRAAVVAMHELPFESVKETFSQTLRADLRNVYRTLQMSRGIYFAPIESRPLIEMVDVESSYD